MVGILVITLGRRESEAFPSAASYNPSGVAALAELLRREGYQVRADSLTTPSLAPGEVPIAFEYSVSRDDFATEDSPFDTWLHRFVGQGGRAVVFSLDPRFQAASRAALARPISVSNRSGRHLSIYAGPALEDLPWLDSDTPQMGLLSYRGGSVADAYAVGKGLLVYGRDGLAATNRFLDRGDDAEFVLSLVRAAAPPGSRLVFTEAAFGNGEQQGLLGTIGRWAEAAWYQCLFFFVVVVVTLGIRFGLPEEARRRQRGMRELVDAVSDTYLRAEATDAALRAARTTADARLRTVLKLPRDASDGERDRLLPESLGHALRDVETASRQKSAGPDEALRLVRRLEAELESFLGPAAAPPSRTHARAGR